MNELRVIPLPSVAMVKEGDDLVAMFLEALDASGLSLEYRDLVIVTSKVVSKSEGQVVDFDLSLIHIFHRRGPGSRDAGVGAHVSDVGD